jgi:hypothetical protein
VTAHQAGHYADRPSASDQDVFTQDREGEGGVDSVPEGVEDGGNVEVDSRMVPPKVARGEDDVFGEGTVAVDTHALRIGAQDSAASHAVAAPAAH